MPFRLHSKGVTVAVRLTPGARQAGFHGVVDTVDGGHALKISVTAPPEDGKANKELITLLAKEWRVPKAAISLLSGDTNRQKVILIQGDGEKLQAQLESWRNEAY